MVQITTAYKHKVIKINNDNIYLDGGINIRRTVHFHIKLKIILDYLRNQIT